MFTLGTKPRYTDNTVDRFQKTNLLYTDDKYLLFQDPTSLGFKMHFEFNQPGCGLLCDADNNNLPNTALNYLNSIGDKSRANYLAAFTSHLRKINLTTPWFFQSINGLNEAWKRRYNEDEFTAILPKDRKLEIECLESIDLRITSLIDMYRKACFDFKYRREVVPWNLRTFTVYIYVYENRTINASGLPAPNSSFDPSALLGIDDVNKKQQEQNYAFLNKEHNAASLKNGIAGLISKPALELEDAPNDKITRVLFKFTQCEFLPDESSEFLSNISNVNGDYTKQKISFSYRNVEEINLYTLYSNTYLKDLMISTLDISTNDVIFKGGNLFLKNEVTRSGGLMNVLQDKLSENLNKIVSMGASRLEDMFKSKLNHAIMGNVFGLSAQNLMDSATQVLNGNPAQLFGDTLNAIDANMNKPIKQTNLTGQKYYDKVTPNKSIDSEKTPGDMTGNSLTNNTKKITNKQRYYDQIKK